MSFILDALQRADAERERGAVPGLHARPIRGPVDTAQSGSRMAMAFAIAAGVVLVGTVGWMWMGTPARPPAPTLPAPMAPVTTALPVAPAVSVTPSPIAPPPPTMPVTRSVEPRKPPSIAKPPPELAKKVDAPTLATSPLLSALPEDIRRQIPTLAISGAVYSDNPAQRLLLVNGQVLPQGSLAAADVTLVEIRANQSEFSFRGTHFRLMH